MAQNPPEGGQRIVARLAYEDVASGVTFLERAFGFAERKDERIENPDGSIVLTELDVVDSRIMVGGVGAHGIGSPKRVGSATQALIVYVDDIDRHFQRAKAAGCAVISEPEDQFWGDRRYEVRDVEGHLWSFHEHTRDVSPEEMQAALRALQED